MMQREWAVKWVIVGVLLVVGVAVFNLLQSLQHDIFVHIGGRTVKAKIADDYSERSKGLSGTNKLNENEGMLFVFDSPEKWSIWMKDMRYSIDVIWLDEQKQVVDKAENLTPESYPTNFTPSKAAKYILEVPAGFVRKYNITVGTLTAFQLPK